MNNEELLKNLNEKNIKLEEELRESKENIILISELHE